MRTRQEILDKISELEDLKDSQRRCSAVTNTIYLRMIESLKWSIGDLEEL
jgi:hypothetical protein